MQTHFKHRIPAFIVLFFLITALYKMLNNPLPAQAHIARYPIIIIPGFSGTILKANEQGANLDEFPDGHGGNYSHAYLPGEEIWVNTIEAAKPGHDDYFDILGLQPDGKTPVAPLGLGGAVREAYQPTIDFFTGKGYVINRDLFIFAYDWRQDIRDNNEMFEELIVKAKSRSGQTRVNIVAHSMGGLVLRNYLTNLNNGQNINRAVTLGTPYLGAPEFLKYLMYGGCVSFRDTNPVCIGIPPSEIKDILQNMTSGYQLLPSKKYYEFYDNSDALHPFPFNDQKDVDENGITGELNYIQLKEMLTNLMYNTPLFTPAEEFRSSIDKTLPVILGGQLNIIVGSGLPTLGQIEERTVISLGDSRLNKKDMHIINGDKSVPLFSASLDDAANGNLLNGNANVFYTNQEHAELPKNIDTLNFINFLFNGDTSGTYNYQGISAQPFKLKGHLLSVHSPMDLHIHDTLGNHTGVSLDGFIEQNIPGSYYETLDDTKFIWLPDDGIYEIRLDAIDNGQFDFKIREFSDDQEMKSTVYENIPISIVSKAQIIFNTEQSTPSTLQLDANGDGALETLINPTQIINQHPDTIAPITEITVEGPAEYNGWYQSEVTIKATTTDNLGGSGIAKTEYTLNDNNEQQYTTPISINQEGIHTLKIWSTDLAGNSETPKEVTIKIDKTAPEALVQFNTESTSIEIVGVDNLSATSTINSNQEEAIITDEAGNTTKIKYIPKDKKEKDTTELKSVTYNNGSEQVLNQNTFQVTFELIKKTSLLQNLEQKIILAGEEKVKARYTAINDITTLEIKSDKERKEKYEKSGLFLIKLITNKGIVQSEVNL
ncbi:MAG: alpha/beta hydrolase [bacterium]|nr:alpha/beta hydrolase [bacterium]